MFNVSFVLFFCAPRTSVGHASVQEEQGQEPRGDDLQFPPGQGQRRYRRVPRRVRLHPHGAHQAREGGGKRCVCVCFLLVMLYKDAMTGVTLIVLIVMQDVALLCLYA